MADKFGPAGAPGRLYRLDIDEAPSGDGAGRLPPIAGREREAPRGVLICIGALGFGVRLGAGTDAANSPCVESGA